MCRGADSKFFNGHTNLTSTRFLVFGVKGLLSVAQNVRSTILLNLLSYMSDKLLTEGNTVAALDELYIWLSNPVAIEYIRNSLKRVRKKESALVLASQNLEDFDQPGVREMTKPLFSIPPHQFLFNAGSIDRRAYMDMLQLEDSEFDLIKFPQRGVCLYKCGNERYLLESMRRRIRKRCSERLADADGTISDAHKGCCRTADQRKGAQRRRLSAGCYFCTGHPDCRHPLLCHIGWGRPQQFRLWKPLFMG